jgi:hypothetical protein
MGYTDNIKLPLTNLLNLYSDGCGDKYDEKHYFNGAYIDLCGMPVDEYMNNPCCCNGDGGGGSGEVSKPTNEILVKVFENDEGVVYYQAFSKFPVASNIVITVLSTDEIATELEIFVGETESKPEIGETKEFKNVKLNMEEDETYKYTPASEEEKVSYNVYIKAMHLNESGIFTDDFEKITMEMNTATDIIYTIKGTTTNYNEFENIEDFEKFCQENQYCFALCLPKNIYDKKQYSIINYGGVNVSSNFNFLKTVTIDGIEYAFLDERAQEDIMPYVPLYNEDVVYEYKLTLNK